MIEIKDRIISLRTEKGMTQSELAKVLGISPSSVGMYEQGRRKPSYELLKSISDYFNVDMDYLVGRSAIKDRGLSSDSDIELEKKVKLLENQNSNEESNIVSTYQLNKYELEEFHKILDMNILMFNDEDLTDENRLVLKNALLKVYIRKLLEKRKKEGR